MRDPLTNDEIHNLLTMTLHGHLPNKTLDRVFATLTEVKELRSENERLKSKLDILVGWMSEGECPPQYNGECPNESGYETPEERCRDCIEDALHQKTKEEG
jgi:hypothetical protein